MKTLFRNFQEWPLVVLMLHKKAEPSQSTKTPLLSLTEQPEKAKALFTLFQNSGLIAVAGTQTLSSRVQALHPMQQQHQPVFCPLASEQST